MSGFVKSEDERPFLWFSSVLAGFFITFLRLILLRGPCQSIEVFYVMFYYINNQCLWLAVVCMFIIHDDHTHVMHMHIDVSIFIAVRNLFLLASLN